MQTTNVLNRLQLQEIIEANERISTTILVEEVLVRKKQIYRYYKELYCFEEPILMVTSVMNAAQYCKIVPANEFDEYRQDYIDTLNLDFEDKEHAFEEISFNSRMLKDMLD